jgi:hypothetical protein
MPRSPRPAGPRLSWEVALLTLVLIVGTALAALAVSARASGSGSSSGSKSLVCSRDDRGGVLLHPAPARRGSATTLVPEGAVGLTICDYNGMNATRSTPQFGLLGIGVTDKDTILKQLTRELDAIKPTPPNAAYSCPMDDGSQAILYFGYGSRSGDVVTVGTNGCNPITNTAMATISYPTAARIPHYLGLGRPVIGQIEALAKPVKGLSWATVVGHLRLCGGPFPGRCYIENDDNGDRVLAQNSDGQWVASGLVHHGRFGFKIATSGTYTVEFYAGNKLVKKLRRRMTVGRTTRVVFLISIM